MCHGVSVEVRGQLFKQLALSFQHVGSGDETQAWQQTFHPPNHPGSPRACVCARVRSQWTGKWLVSLV